MNKINIDKKQSTIGGISQLAIFGIIAGVGVITTLATNIAGGIMNLQANSKKKKVEPRKTFNVGYQKSSSYVY